MLEIAESYENWLRADLAGPYNRGKRRQGTGPDRVKHDVSVVMTACSRTFSRIIHNGMISRCGPIGVPREPIFCETTTLLLAFRLVKCWTSNPSPGSMENGSALLCISIGQTHYTKSTRVPWHHSQDTLMAVCVTLHSANPVAGCVCCNVSICNGLWLERKCKMEISNLLGSTYLCCDDVFQTANTNNSRDPLEKPNSCFPGVIRPIRVSILPTMRYIKSARCRGPCRVAFTCLGYRGMRRFFLVDGVH